MMISRPACYTAKLYKRRKDKRVGKDDKTGAQSVMITCGKLRQEDGELKASLGYRINSHSERLWLKGTRSLLHGRLRNEGPECAH